MADKYRKKPDVVEAVQWDGQNREEIKTFVGESLDAAWSVGGYCFIDTLEGKMNAARGDWIIRGVKGEFYPCKPDIFEATYEPADAPVSVDARLAALTEALEAGREFQGIFDSIMADENDGEFSIYTDAELHNANVKFRVLLADAPTGTDR